MSVGSGGVQFALGSTGGSGGAGDPSQGSWWTINAGAISTTGVLSDAIVAQGIGGGGGLAGFVSIGAQAPPLGTVTLGATGSAGGNGSAVTLTSASSVWTKGAGAIGLIGQSVGGGGGIAQAYGVSGAGTVTLGASGGAAGNGANVSLISNATISTSGIDAHALVAQSIGGGGGLFLGFDAAGNALAANVQASTGGGGGNGGNVTVESNANIGTTGKARTASSRNPSAAAAASSAVASSPTCCRRRERSPAVPADRARPVRSPSTARAV